MPLNMLMLYPNLNESDCGDGRLDLCYKEICYKGTAVYLFTDHFINAEYICDPLIAR